jgi:hypothetical protein
MLKRINNAFLSLLLTTNADGSDKRKLLCQNKSRQSSSYISVQYDGFVLFGALRTYFFKSNSGTRPHVVSIKLGKLLHSIQTNNILLGFFVKPTVLSPISR